MSYSKRIFKQTMFRVFMILLSITIFQRLYCLSERNVVAYDMKGNFLFELKR
jgi:hypothetical protein